MSKSLEECRAAFGKVFPATVAGSEYVFRKPKSIDWRRYKGAAMSAKADAQGGFQIDGPGLLAAYEALCLACVVSHTPAEMAAVEDDFLDFFQTLGAEISRVTNEEMAAFEKKASPSSSKP